MPPTWLDLKKVVVLIAVLLVPFLYVPQLLAILFIMSLIYFSE